ncbi:Serine/threonine-protein kinase csk1 [Schizosaccharomyces pombe]
MRGKLILESIDHPHIERIVDSFIDNEAGSVYLITSFKSFVLSDVMDEISIDTKCKIVLQISSALEYLEKHGILHRDIHPNNILLDSMNGPAYLSDFSIAWSKQHPGEEVQELIPQIGTGHYRAIETLFGCHSYGHEVDRWTFGILIAELFSNQALFDDGSSEGWPSELRLTSSIIQTLGTPNPSMWPELSTFPDWNKFIFHEYPPKPWSEILPSVDTSIQYIVSHLVTYSNRASPSFVIESFPKVSARLSQYA